MLFHFRKKHFRLWFLPIKSDILYCRGRRKKQYPEGFQAIRNIFRVSPAISLRSCHRRTGQLRHFQTILAGNCRGMQKIRVQKSSDWRRPSRKRFDAGYVSVRFGNSPTGFFRHSRRFRWSSGRTTAIKQIRRNGCHQSRIIQPRFQQLRRSGKMAFVRLVSDRFTWTLNPKEHHLQVSLFEVISEIEDIKIIAVGNRLRDLE